MDSTEIQKAFEKELNCPIDFSDGGRALYATDASSYRFIPYGVIWPRSNEDVIKAVEICRRFEVPVVSRGGGTALAGQTTNHAVIIDHSRFHNKIVNIDPIAKTAVIQPGIVLDDLRREAEKYQLTFGPDPATHNRCTLGGMLGNNSCGVHSVMAGRTADNVISLDVLTYDGVRMTVGETSRQELAEIIRSGGRRSEIYAGMSRIIHQYQDLVRKRFPRIPRRVSGYNLDELLPENQFNVARALVGTEGTCVTILEAKVRLVPSPQFRALVIVGFDELHIAGDACSEILKFKPIGLEAIDDFLIENMKIKHLHTSYLPLLPEGHAWLLVEVGADSENEKKEKADQIADFVAQLKGYKSHKIFLDHELQGKIWKIRESSLGASVFVPGQGDTFEGWEDSAVPTDKVGDYVRELKELFKKYNYRASVYGHFGQGCVHCRINFDLFTHDGIEAYRKFTNEAADLVLKYGGSLSGEHGDGQLRADLLPKMFGPELVQAFAEFKALWDPKNKMNPGKVVHPHTRIQNLRFGSHWSPRDPETFFKYVDDRGSFLRATTRCVGVGLCRREDEGVMCPSYMVTREEKHSTRGRAHMLYEMLQGQTLKEGWKSEEVKEALDLCLACKGCKGDCPVNVDMATYKAEFLAHYYQHHWRPREAFAMGQIRKVARLAAHFPRLVNWFAHAPILNRLAKWMAGIHAERTLPRFADKNFLQLQNGKDNSEATSSRRVVLWVDTFNNYFNPPVALAAQRVLERAGCHILFPKSRHCCGRPLYDFGFLHQARERLVEIMTDFREEIRNGTHFVFLEPSCCSVIKEELTNFFPNDPDARRLKAQTFMLSEYLIKKVPDFDWPRWNEKVLIQGHCHHKSVLDMDSEKEAFRRMGADYEVMDSGCCGMAGAFGFSKDHYSVSQACGERVLFPKIRENEKSHVISANGFSCREQIEQGTGQQVKHFAEILDEALQNEKPHQHPKTRPLGSEISERGPEISI